MMVQTSVKSFFSKDMRGDKFQTKYVKLLKENVTGLNDSKLHGVNYVGEDWQDAEELLNLRTLDDMMEKISKIIHIQCNHRIQGRRRESSGEPHQQRNADKESPFLLYIGLKVFSATRSSKIICILHAHGLCVSYDRILRITQGLGEALLQLFHGDDAVTPGLPRAGLFTVGAKDKIGKNACCTISKSHYHETRKSLFYFPSSFNDGFERQYQQFAKVPSSRCKKVGELPSFYTDVAEIADLPQAYYFTVSTVNIPENVNNSDLVSIVKKREIEWLEHISSLNEFTSDSSWSVYNAKKDDTEVVPCVYSILTLLWQSVTTYVMQKHCIEVAKNVIDALNPGQVTFDTSDQPIYALSRRLQQMFPDSLGSGKYLPMFGGFHIKKRLLEIHGQLIAGSGLAQFFDQAKVSITAAGNVVVNVSQITSARYLLQVCSYAEHKAMSVVFDSSESTADIQDKMEKKASESPMFHYWKMIFDLQILILMFIQSERERDFALYFQVFKSIMKYIFGFNHCNRTEHCNHKRGWWCCRSTF